MAGTVQAPQVPSDRGVVPVYFAPAAQNEVPNNGLLMLHVKATGVLNVTLKNQTVQEGNPGPDLVINIPGAGERMIGPIPPGLFNLSNGNAQINFDTPANCTVALYSLPRS